jgi:FkbH-like protein
METAEVKAAFPEVECLTFPKGDYQGIWRLLRQLRDLFGKSKVLEEDAVRLKSIRSGGAFENSSEAQNATSDRFLEKANAHMLFVCSRRADDRAFDLINKTNQFNLNGRRLTEGEFVGYLSDPDAALLTVTYEDKYGPLGKIATLLVRLDRQKLHVDFWVMSCRAFSRRIEHQCLKYLFERFDVNEITIDYQPTDRNGPLKEFLAQFLGTVPSGCVGISRMTFFDRTPPLFHHVAEGDNG